MKNRKHVSIHVVVVCFFKLYVAFGISEFFYIESMDYVRKEAPCVRSLITKLRSIGVLNFIVIDVSL